MNKRKLFPDPYIKELAKELDEKLGFSTAETPRSEREVFHYVTKHGMDPLPVVSNYSYAASKEYCAQIGLRWLGPEFIKGIDADAFKLGCSQEMVDTGMRHALWHIKWLFTPSNYGWKSRLAIAWFFITGLKPK